MAVTNREAAAVAIDDGLLVDDPFDVTRS